MKKILIAVIVIMVAMVAIKYFVNFFMDRSVGNSRAEWDKAYTNGNKFFYKKDYSRAIPYYDQSIAELRKLISEDPSNRSFIFQVLFCKAICYQELGESEKTVSIYQEIIEESKQVGQSEKGLLDDYISGYIGTALIKQGLIYLNNKEELARKKFEEALDVFSNGKTLMDLNLKRDIEKVIKYYANKNEIEVSKKFEEILEEDK
jgi:tetratricopeptide (TPR) repeat protein